MAGDTTQPKRPRYESNERFDTVDANAASQAPRDFDDAQNRALLVTPRNTVATPTGVIVTGFSITLNPTAAFDGLIRINTELGVALDSNGRTIIKPSPTTLDVAIPIGTFQVYVYYVENATDNAKRRFLPAAPPFVEFTNAIFTAHQGGVNVFLRSNASPIVPEDVVNGATTPLCLIGIATNTGAGDINLTGRVDNTTIALYPNGSDITNRLSTVAPPSLVPAANTSNGSPRTLHDLITAALYTAGQMAWLGSDFLTPMASNNYGAYSPPAGGADKAFRQALGYVTIGNGTTVTGDFNTSDYADANALLTAALASLPAAGGTLLLKRGTQLVGFAGATVALPAGKTVEIRGEHAGTPATLPEFTFAATEGLVCSATGRLVLRNLHIRHTSTAITLATAPCEVYDVYSENTSVLAAGAFLQGTSVSDLTIERLTATTVLTTASADALVLRITGEGRRIRTRRIRHLPGSPVFEDSVSIAILDMREDVVIEDTTYESAGPGPSLAGTFGIITLDTTLNTLPFNWNRVIRNAVQGPTLMAGVNIGNVGSLIIDGLQSTTDVPNFASSLKSAAVYAGTGPVLVKNSLLTGMNLTGAFLDLTFDNCSLFSVGTINGGAVSDLGRITLNNCRIGRSAADFVLLTIQGRNVDHVRVSNCTITGTGGPVFGVPAAAVQVRAQAGANFVNRVEFLNNTVESWGNYVHTVTTVGWQFIFAVHAPLALTIVCSGNTASHIGDTATGVAKKGYYLLHVGGTGFSGTDNVTTAMTSCWHLEMDGNVLGTLTSGLSGVGDAVMLARLVIGAMLDSRIVNNVLHPTWSTGGTDMTISNLIYLSGECDINWIVDNNLFNIWKNSATKLSINVVYIGAMSACANFSFSYNTIYTQPVAGAFGWDHVTGWGHHITGGGTIQNWSVFGNQHDSGGFVGGFRTRATGAWVFTSLIQGGGIPGAGVPYTFNNDIAGG